MTNLVTYEVLPPTGQGPWYTAIRSLPDRLLVCEVMSVESAAEAQRLAKVLCDHLNGEEHD